MLLRWLRYPVAWVADRLMDHGWMREMRASERASWERLNPISESAFPTRTNEKGGRR